MLTRFLSRNRISKRSSCSYGRREDMGKKMTFALDFCNRGFMPGELIYGAREDMVKAVTPLV